MVQKVATLMLREMIVRINVNRRCRLSKVVRGTLSGCHWDTLSCCLSGRTHFRSNESGAPHATVRKRVPRKVMIRCRSDRRL